MSSKILGGYKNMSKPELTQKELQALSEQGKIAIWQYNTLYQIDHSNNLGKGEYYLRQTHIKPIKGIGVTKKGRFLAMLPEQAQKYL